MVSIAIVGFLIVIFIPTFDNYKKRQKGFEIAQEIAQEIQKTRTYALAPSTLNMKNIDLTTTPFLVFQLNDAGQYGIFARGERLNKPYGDYTTIQESQNIDYNWKIKAQGRNLDYLDPENLNLLHLCLVFRSPNGELSLTKKYTATDSTESGNTLINNLQSSTLEFYIVPTSINDLSNCKNGIGCVKMNLNLYSGAVSYTAYTR